MYQSSKHFNNKPVVDVSNETKKQDLSKISPLIRVEPENGKEFPEYLKQFLATQDTSKMDSLVIGFWSSDYDLLDGDGLGGTMKELLAQKDKMPKLKALFLGAIEQEESEISWIGLVDIAPFMMQADEAFELESFRARGDGNFFKSDFKNNHIKTLALETGGMSSKTIKHIINAEMPSLEYLELWIGSEEYGSTSMSDLAPLLSTTKFPNLRYLGLRNCDFADELATAVATAPILKQLDVLDLSLGNISDKGAEALAESKLLGNLKQLKVDHHYIGDKALEKLKAAMPTLSYADKQVDDEYDGEVYRYIFVSE